MTKWQIRLLTILVQKDKALLEELQKFADLAQVVKNFLLANVHGIIHRKEETQRLCQIQEIQEVVETLQIFLADSLTGVETFHPGNVTFYIKAGNSKISRNSLLINSRNNLLLLFNNQVVVRLHHS